RYVPCAPMLIGQHEHIGVPTTNNRACHTNFPATTKVGGSPITTGIPLVALECPTSRLNRLEAQPIPQPSRGSGHHGLPQSEAQGAHSVLLCSHTLASLRSNLWSGGKSCDARIPTTWTRCCPRRRERPRRRASDERDERATLHLDYLVSSQSFWQATKHEHNAGPVGNAQANAPEVFSVEPEDFPAAKHMCESRVDRESKCPISSRQHYCKRLERKVVRKQRNVPQTLSPR